MCGETERAGILAQYGLDSLEDDPELQRISRFVAELCNAPVALVTVVEMEQQRFLAREGVEERTTPRPVSFCAHTMLEAGLVEVPDAKDDPRFSDNPLVTGEPHIRYYAGAPLISSEGAPVGSLCVLDYEPRPEGLTDFQREGLQVLAGSVMRRLQSQRLNLETMKQAAARERELKQLLQNLPQIAFSVDSAGHFEYYNSRLTEFSDAEQPSNAEGWQDLIHPDDHDRVFPHWYDAFEKGEEFRDEFRIRSSDGSWHWMMSRVVPTTPEDPSQRRWFGLLIDIDEAHQLSEARNVMAQELSHRIKNIFAVVSGLVMLSARKQPEHLEFADEISSKIRALGRAHDFVRPNGQTDSATLHGVLSELFEPYTDRGEPRVRVSGDDVSVGARAATPLALVFHELATNSAKYGALSQENGSVLLTIAEQDGALLLRWREDSVETPDTDHTGFGSKLLTMSVEGQLRGLMVRKWVKGGLTVELTVPVDAITG